MGGSLRRTAELGVQHAVSTWVSRAAAAVFGFIACSTRAGCGGLLIFCKHYFQTLTFKKAMFGNSEIHILGLWEVLTLISTETILLCIFRFGSRFDVRNSSQIWWEIHLKTRAWIYQWTGTCCLSTRRSESEKVGNCCSECRHIENSKWI